MYDDEEGCKGLGGEPKEAISPLDVSGMEALEIPLDGKLIGKHVVLKQEKTWSLPVRESSVGRLMCVRRNRAAYSVHPNKKRSEF